jgi:hypothetical protein
VLVEYGHSNGPRQRNDDFVEHSYKDFDYIVLIYEDWQIE